MNVDYRLMPLFEASWEFEEAARAGFPESSLPTAQSIEQWRDGEALSVGAAAAIRRWLEDDR